MEAALGTQTEEQRRSRPKDPPLLLLLTSDLVSVPVRNSSQTPLRVFMRWLLTFMSPIKSLSQSPPPRVKGGSRCGAHLNFYTDECRAFTILGERSKRGRSFGALPASRKHHELEMDRPEVENGSMDSRIEFARAAPEAGQEARRSVNSYGRPLFERYWK